MHPAPQREGLAAGVGDGVAEPRVAQELRGGLGEVVAAGMLLVELPRGDLPRGNCPALVSSSPGRSGSDAALGARRMLLSPTRHDDFLIFYRAGSR